MEVFFLWIAMSLVIGIMGNKRRIGSLAAFFISLLLSPFVGLIVTVFSSPKT